MLEPIRSLSSVYWRLRIGRYAKRVAKNIAPELRQAALRKFGDDPASQPERKEYVESRAAQLTQPLVDNILRANPRIPSILGNQLVVSSAGKATNLVLHERRRRAAA